MRENENYGILIDTCVWLDLAKDPASMPVLTALTDLVKSGRVTIYLPKLIEEEFKRNKDRVTDVARQRLSQDFKRIKGVVDKFGNEDKKLVVGVLEDINHKLPMLTDSIFETINLIEELFKLSEKTIKGVSDKCISFSFVFDPFFNPQPTKNVTEISITCHKPL